MYYFIFMFLYSIASCNKYLNNLNFIRLGGFSEIVRDDIFHLNKVWYCIPYSIINILRILETQALACIKIEA